MTIKYKIVEVHPATHSIVVRYYTDKIGEESLAAQRVDGVLVRCVTDFSIDLPLPTPQDAALRDLISLRAPKAWLETQEAVKDKKVDTSMSGLLSLLGVEAVVVTPSPKAFSKIPVTSL